MRTRFIFLIIILISGSVLLLLVPSPNLGSLPNLVNILKNCNSNEVIILNIPEKGDIAIELCFELHLTQDYGPFLGTFHRPLTERGIELRSQQFDGACCDVDEEHKKQLLTLIASLPSGPYGVNDAEIRRRDVTLRLFC